MTSPAVAPAQVLLERLTIEGLQDEAWAWHVLAACEGAEALTRFLDDGIEPARPRRAGGAPAGGAALREAPRAYLESIGVRGFRGVGPERVLALTPGPGLTLVIGRNGSGKSSFAEALEVLLTGDSLRWSGKGSRFWKEGWRNLHEGAEPEIRARFVAEGLGRVDLTRRWAADAAIEDGATLVARPGAADAELNALGWDAAAADYRPFLSHSELESLFEEGPSKLYRALLKGLGLEEFEAIRRVLAEAQSVRRRRRDDVREAARILADDCDRRRATESDDRLGEASVLLRARDWNLDRLAALATGAAPAETSLAALLGEAARLKPPDRDDVRALVESLRGTAAEMRALTSREAGRASGLASLLEAALAMTAAAADATCPVCRTPEVLTLQWRERTTEEVARLREAARELREAQQRAADLLRRAQMLCLAPPAWLADDRLSAFPLASDTREAARAWHRGQRLTDPEELAAHLERHAPDFSTSIEGLASWAKAELNRRQDVWQPVAARLGAWVETARAAARGRLQTPLLKDAEEWVKATIDHLRDERFRPIADRAIANWSLIRLQSNVELTAIVLEGTGRQQSVGLRVAVDGKEAGALGVMSQGELNALALSLFLPRAALPESPFGFVIVDDPVQAMDPSRVEGLARVLEQAAKARQVVVFTHDDRLPEAVRRLQIEARMIEVVRRAQSVVELRPRREPVDAYLDDARALMIAARDDGIPEGVVVRVVPGFCRAAIEASCTEVVRRRRLARGDRHAEVEVLLEGARTLNRLMALALFDDPAKASENVKTIRNKWQPWAEDVFRSVQSGSHGEFVGDLARLVDQTGTLTGHIRRLK